MAAPPAETGKGRRAPPDQRLFFHMACCRSDLEAAAWTHDSHFPGSTRDLLKSLIALRTTVFWRPVGQKRRYQQRRADRTKTPLPTEIRILCAQARLNRWNQVQSKHLQHLNHAPEGCINFPCQRHSGWLAAATVWPHEKSSEDRKKHFLSPKDVATLSNPMMPLFI